MKIPNYFYIEGNKILLFRKEGDNFITFDPERLEFLKLNFIGAEIMYYISVHMKLEEIVNCFAEKYSISKNVAKGDILNFIEGCSFMVHIKELLTELEIYVEKS